MHLTPNRRLADYLLNKGVKEVLPIPLWLEQCYQELRSKNPKEWPLLLKPHEEMVVWEQIILQSEKGQEILKANSIARLAREAWYLSCQWEIPAASETVSWYTEEIAAYVDWQEAYQRVCQKNHWTDGAQFVDHLKAAIQQSQLLLPSYIQGIGFDELTPQLKTFFEVALAMGSTIQMRSLVSTKGDCYRLKASDEETELRLAAEMAKQWCLKHPESTIGVVVPNLEYRRSQVVSIFNEMRLSEPHSSLTFNVAAPIALSQYPLCEAALMALGMMEEKLEIEIISQFLRSPFFGGGMKEQEARAEWDVFLRSQGERYFSLEFLVASLAFHIQERELNLTELHQRFSQFLSKRSLLKGKKRSFVWASLMEELLTCLGWPGERTLTSTEYQIKACWDEVLTEYRDMDKVLGLHSFNQGLLQILRLAKESPFLPQSSKTNLQILGALEALGLPFDFLWVVGLHQEAWPLEPAPNPFIPIKIQKEKGLPHSSATRELWVAKRMTERFCEGAKKVIFSYPEALEDRTIQGSALIQPLPEMTLETLGLKEPLSLLRKKAQFNQQKALKNSREKTIVFKENLFSHEIEPLEGGVQTLRLQALCPFRAFSEIRLKAKPIPKTPLGLTALERGEMVHAILYHFWEVYPQKTQQALLDSNGLTQHLNEVIDKVLVTFMSKRPQTLKGTYLKLERERLYALIHQFIELEKTRPFFTVIEREVEKTLTLQGLSFKVRIDRIDRLSEGDEILIDYKTGEVSMSDWFGERPSDPQLPVYCLAQEYLPSGVVFAVIRLEESRFQGVVKEKSLLPGGKTVLEVKRWGSENSYEKQCTTWQTTLETLAQEFKRGEATVDPKEGENTCRLCALKLLCRVVHSESV